jgi:hypothetical protein
VVLVRERGVLGLRGAWGVGVANPRVVNAEKVDVAGVYAFFCGGKRDAKRFKSEKNHLKFSRAREPDFRLSSCILFS